MIAGDNSTLDCSKPHTKKLKPKTEPDHDAEFRCRFDNLLKFSRPKICSPPMLGNGQSVNLFKLYSTVREKGGYSAVSENRLWDVVAVESGFGISFASSVKLVYAKYLEALEKWLERAIEDKNLKAMSNDCASDVEVGVSADLGFELKGHSTWKPVLNVCSELDSNSGVGDEESSIHTGSGRSVVDFVEVGNSSYDMTKSSPIDFSSYEDRKSNSVQENLDSNLISVKASDEDEVKSNVMELNESKKCDDCEENDVTMVDSDAIEDSKYSHKRKREPVCKILKWITGIARNPCDDVVSSLPELSKWESYGNEQLWKQVLLVRESLFLKRKVDTVAGQSILQKNRKMHPCMYDDHVGSIYNFRERLKCHRKQLYVKTLSHPRACSQMSSAASKTNLNSNANGIPSDSLLDCPVQNPIPLGPDFQAEVPEWDGVIYESDSKWVGIRVWPPEKVNNRLVEREPIIGKGRRDSCGCEVPKSVECVRFHITERRMRVKRELGTAFYHWRFDKMGEDVKLSWTKEEEKKFKAIVQSNSSSLNRCFWDKILKSFSNKRSEDLVNYYFNVYLMKRRAHQNRVTPNDIHSDDDDELDNEAAPLGHQAPKSPGSILYSAKKSCKSGR